MGGISNNKIEEKNSTKIIILVTIIKPKPNISIRETRPNPTQTDQVPSSLGTELELYS